MEPYGVVTGPGRVRIERVLPGPIERVWQYLTDAELRGKWLAGGPMEPRVGGNVEMFFHHADLSAEKTPPEKFKEMECGIRGEERVTQYDPPRLLGITWGHGEPDASEVTFELTEQGDNVLLVLTHQRLADKQAMMNVSSGWHAHLAILSDVLHEVEPRGFWSMVTRLEEEYTARYAE